MFYHLPIFQIVHYFIVVQQYFLCLVPILDLLAIQIECLNFIIILGHFEPVFLFNGDGDIPQVIVLECVLLLKPL